MPPPRQLRARQDDDGIAHLSPVGRPAKGEASKLGCMPPPRQLRARLEQRSWLRALTLLLLLAAPAVSVPVSRGRMVLAYDSNRQPVPEVYHKCEDVIRMCQAQCSDAPQCLVSCVACPHDARDMCWVLPDQCRLHADG